MSARPSPREQHDAHQDEVNRVRQLAKHERAVMSRARLHAVMPLVQSEHAFATPIVHPHDHTKVMGHMDAPGSVGTDFPGCVV